MPTSSPRLVTLGYEGRSAEELVEELRELGVRVLVDVRLTPLSRKPGLSKTKLSGAVEAAGMAYVHLPELGNPKDNREGFRDGDARARTRFRSRLRTKSGAGAVGRVIELTNDGTVALLCFERHSEQCHRHIVSAEALRLAPELSVAHA